MSNPVPTSDSGSGHGSSASGDGAAPSRRFLSLRNGHTWIDRRGSMARIIGRWETVVDDRKALKRRSTEHPLERVESAVESWSLRRADQFSKK